ncbi:helix-turn-helix domain-containing protein [Shewanella eurypsychrophilus]|uniref:Helix-turn-helix domain-containing protein n=1 Tax=Shewanella eurypsychrophilus TaxID=2593656 RepID=A0ABX6VFR9_9GAMM|nr:MULTISPECIES: helix-turn-helix domain-containing protein [Shewanella]QFU24021.1 helix-turn-helix domain-containing protein [Shewanella sp. YLB-09]QPG59231.1 helix-turn-helix domain-containing protein [Shewanella eurypsychrophilus]
MLNQSCKAAVISKRIEQRKNQLGISNSEIAHDCGVTVRTVVNWTTGVSVPSITKLVPLSFLLKKPISWIVTGTEDLPQWLSISVAELIEFHKQLAKYTPSERKMLFNSISTLMNSFDYILESRAK